MTLPERPDLTKIVYVFPPGTWHGLGSETLWAQRVAPNHYALRSVPFYATGMSYDDVVAAEPEGVGHPVIRETVRPSGHSTYRIFLSEGIDVESDSFRRVWGQLERIGASFEGANKRLLAIDLPPSTDIYQAYEFLDQGEREGVWSFEEGHVGHALRNE